MQQEGCLSVRQVLQVQAGSHGSNSKGRGKSQKSDLKSHRLRWKVLQKQNCGLWYKTGLGPSHSPSRVKGGYPGKRCWKNRTEMEPFQVPQKEALSNPHTHPARARGAEGWGTAHRRREVAAKTCQWPRARGLPPRNSQSRRGSAAFPRGPGQRALTWLSLGVYGGGKRLFLRCPKPVSGNFSRGSWNPDALTHCPPLSSPSPPGVKSSLLAPPGALRWRGHVLDSSAGTELWSAFTLPPSPPSAATQLRPGRASESGSCSLISVNPPPSIPHPHPHSVGTCARGATPRPRTQTPPRTGSPGVTRTL